VHMLRNKWSTIVGIGVLGVAVATAALVAGPLQILDGRESQADLTAQREDVTVRVTLGEYLRSLCQVANDSYGGNYPDPETRAQAFRLPYAFFSSALQQEIPLDEYRARLDTLADLQVLQLWAAPGRVDADAPPAEQRFFVELKTVEYLDGKTAQVYYSGCFTLGQTDDGWRIAQVELEPENLTWQLGGHQPWRGDPALVAVVALGGELDVPIDDSPQAIRVTQMDDGRAAVMVPTAEEEPEWHKVIVAPLFNGTWQALSWQ